MKIQEHDSAPVRTSGHVLNWPGGLFDFVANVMTLGRLGKIRDTIVTLAGIREVDRVLDIGCGTGSLAIKVGKRVGLAGAVCGIDPAPRMLAAARLKAGRCGAQVEFQRGVIEAIPYPDQSFDVVLNSFVLHHLPDDVKRRGFAEVRRVLRPGGRLFAVDLRKQRFSLHDLIARLVGGKPESQTNIVEVGPMLEAAGFRNIRIGETGHRAICFVEAFA